MSSSPRVRRMVMFKHGVAYLERAGKADGAFELSFRRDEMNDVLKSLAVWINSEKSAGETQARVERVSFEAPEDAKEALNARGLAIAEGEAMSGVLRSLRGRRVRVSAGADSIEGDVIGIEKSPGGDQPERRSLVLRRANGVLQVLDLATVSSVEALDDASRASLDFLVEKSRAVTSAEHKVVRVELRGKADDVHVAYVIPAPVWRVSYRVIREGDSTVLMAQGIVHNPADEDLEDIELTLTTGQPVSFQIDLYKPQHVTRVMVQETSRAGAKPQTFERAPMPQSPPAMPAPMAAAPRSASMPAAPPSFGPPGGMSDGMYASAQQDSATLQDRGELFEYRLPHPIGLSRGGSAMVPLLAQKLDASRERIWRDGRNSSPDLVIAFSNTTGAVLEEGATVVYDEGVYAGEAMLPFSPRGSSVRLAFAKDLALRCRRESSVSHHIASVRLANVALVEELRHQERHVLIAESDHQAEVEVIFELPKNTNRTLEEASAQPFEETASFRRFRFQVPAHGKAELIVVERWLDARTVRYEQLLGRELSTWLEGRFLDRATFDALSVVMNAWAHAKAHDEQRARAERDQGDAYTKQQKLAEQLNVLKEGGPEGVLRLRYVKELEREQDRVNASEAEIRKLRDAAEQARNFATHSLQQIVAANAR